MTLNDVDDKVRQAAYEILEQATGRLAILGSETLPADDMLKVK